MPSITGIFVAGCPSDTEGHVKFESEFRKYLTTKFVSGQTGKHYSPKAAGDQLSRCRRIEKHFQLQLGPGSLLPESKANKIIEKIKLNGQDLGSTEKLPYGYLPLVRALRLYLLFLNHLPG
jgi:hypothetical protein